MIPCTGVATVGPRGAMAPSHFSVPSMSWFTFSTVSTYYYAVAPSYIASNTPEISCMIFLNLQHLHAETIITHLSEAHTERLE